MIPFDPLSSGINLNIYIKQRLDQPAVCTHAHAHAHLGPH